MNDWQAGNTVDPFLINAFVWFVHTKCPSTNSLEYRLSCRGMLSLRALLHAKMSDQLEFGIQTGGQMMFY